MPIQALGGEDLGCSVELLSLVIKHLGSRYGSAAWDHSTEQIRRRLAEVEELYRRAAARELERRPACGDGSHI